ncbi:MAG TPA: hypothetical protein PLV68_01385, partial [Ilumatobacteraceae bacterium]|nr:hypothetical protein [Ilumatobacteraceae bacterium]
EMQLADWASITDQPGVTYDAIHLNSTGQQLYSSMLATLVRTSDTWWSARSEHAVTVAGLNGVPADAKAVAVNLTVTTPRSPGFLTAWACGEPMPPTSNLNFMSDQTVAVSAVVNVGTGGQICIFNSTDTQVIVDVQGYFGPDSDYVTVAPSRVIDTRDDGGVHAAGEPLAVRVTGVADVPDDAAAVAVTVTVADNTAPGWVLSYPCDEPQTTPIALVNYIQYTATPSFALVKPGADGTICLRSLTPANLIVDVFGYLPAGSSVSVMAPTRLLDTRGGAPIPALTDVVVPVVGVEG